ANIAQGFRFVGTTAPIRALLLLIGAVSFFALPYTVLMPLFADTILHAGARGLGILMGAAGVGALIGSLTLASRSTVIGLGRWVAIACATFGISLSAFALSKPFVLSSALLVIAGGATMVQMAASNTLIQSMVPDELRGGVMAVYSLMFVGMVQLDSLHAGTIAAVVWHTSAVRI